MDDQEVAKLFLKAWARYTLALSSAQQPVRNELTKEPAVMQIAEQIFRDEIGTDKQRRAVATQMALAEVHSIVEHR